MKKGVGTTFNFTKQCKTTIWHYNCGLNCFSHLIGAKLANGELQQRFANHPAYIALLDTFQEYYHLTDRPTWDDIKELHRRFPVATDWEGIFAPVLRKYLGNILIEDAESLWDRMACLGYSDYLYEGKVKDIAEPIYGSNKKYMETLKAVFDAQKSHAEQMKITQDEIEIAQVYLSESKNSSPSAREVAQRILTLRKDEIHAATLAHAKAYWLREGCKAYGKWVGDLNISEMISVGELAQLGMRLEIGIYAHSPDGLMAEPYYPYLWLLIMHNNGNHWTYEGANQEEADSHNLYYPPKDELDFGDFLADGALSGEFKTYITEDEYFEKRIHERVKEVLEAKKAQVPPVTFLRDMHDQKETAKTAATDAFDLNKLAKDFRT